MKRSRQLHLWIGLICSILILIEAITGLLLSEPWLIGAQGKGEMRGEFRHVQQSPATDQTQPSAAQTDPISQNPSDISSAGEGPSGYQPDARKGQSSLMMFVRQLHEGRIGSTDVTWLADVAAIGLIILTVTGITLSMRTLRAQRIRHKKLGSASEDSEAIHI